jgi:hypothetical protein
MYFKWGDGGMSILGLYIRLSTHPTHVTWVITLNQLGGCSSQGYRP